MKALIFAAGKGTRLAPFTESHPKALVEVGGMPMLQRTLFYLHQFGIQDFVINVHHFGEQIIAFLEANQNFGFTITISDERADLLETGGGLLKAQRYLRDAENPTFLVMNADILTDIDLRPFIETHVQQNHLITLAVSDRKSSRKLLVDAGGTMRGWTNLKTKETILDPAYTRGDVKEVAFSGIHCLSTGIFQHIRRDGKFSIMEEYKDLCLENKVHTWEHSGQLVDIGTPETLAAARALYKK